LLCSLPLALERCRAARLPSLRQLSLTSDVSGLKSVTFEWGGYDARVHDPQRFHEDLRSARCPATQSLRATGRWRRPCQFLRHHARVFVNTKVDPFSANRYQAYLEVFKSLPATEQAEVLRAASDDMARRQATVPEYMGGYFTGQERQIEEMAIANVLEKKYGAKIDRPKVYAQTIVQSLEGSLRRLRTDHVDLLMCPHGAASPEEVRIPEIFEAFEKLKQQG